MENRSAQVDAFFTAYEKRFNDALAGKEVDTEEVIGSFTDAFLEASPMGVICGKNDANLASKIRQGFEFYHYIGTRSMVITGKELTTLDEMHDMVKVHWHYTAQKKALGMVEIDFDVIYLLQAREDSIKIFAYITGDEQKVLQEHGLLPEEAVIDADSHFE